MANPILKFDVPGAPAEAPQLAVPPAVDKPIASGLATIEKPETPEGRDAVNCVSMLPDDEAAKAKSEAAKLIPQMLDNSQVLMTYGTSSLTGINKLIDRLMTELPANDNGFIKGVMTDLVLNMKAIKGKYDLNTPQGRKSYDEWENGFFKKLWRRGRNYVESMRTDMMSTHDKLAAIEKDITARMMQMVRSIGYLDELYDENENATFELIKAIAVMESISDLVQQEVNGLPPATPGTERRQEEYKQRLADLKLQMDVKIGEYKGRLWVAWATSPQVRMMRVLNVGMAEKLNEAVGLTIPTMKLAIVQMRIKAEAVEAAKASGAVSDTTNEMLRELAAGSASSATDVMRAVQTPTILPETVTAVTDSLVQMAENILAEVNDGNQRRSETYAIMGKSKQILDGSQAHYSDAVVNGIVGESKTLLATPSRRALPPVGTYA